MRQGMRKLTVQLTASLVAWTGAGAGAAMGLTATSEDGAAPLTQSAAAAEDRPDVLVLALQKPAPASQDFAALRGGDAAAGLLGGYGLTAADVLRRVAPNLASSDAVTLQLEHAFTTADGQTVHEAYRLIFGALPLAGAQLLLHHNKNRLVLVRAELPSFRLPAEPFTAADFVAPAALGFAVAAPWRQTQRAVIAESGGFPAPAWELVRTDGVTGQGRVLLVDAQTGAVLRDEALGFAAAYTGDVYPRNPLQSKLHREPLPGLTGPRLDGGKLQVYGETSEAARAQPTGGVFSYDPDDGGTPGKLFEQVQAYYGVERAYRFFRDRFAYDLGKDRVTVYVGAGSGNAVYTPADHSIRIGRDSDALVNLARDADVVAHEFSHHVIVGSLTSRSGESGILHEGYADYFAYAMSGDPYLAESVQPGSPYLRTALLPAADRYDDPDVQQWSAHDLGQLWSAVLWALRDDAGADAADQLAYASVRYLGASSGFADAVLGLLNADRDLFPLPDEAAESGVYGRHKCAIMGAVVDRGFAAYLAGYDGGSCGLDLVQLAKDSHDSLDDGDGEGGKGKFRMLGRDCAVVGDARGAASAVWLLAAALGVPLLLRRRRGARTI
jgi:hypothetical protein